MKLFNRKAGNQTININGQRVKFTNCVATVEDAFGAEVLKLGLPGLYEEGKQPAVELPSDLRLKSSFAEREAFYDKEIKRLSHIKETREKRIEVLEAEVAIWKKEYERVNDLNSKLAAGTEVPPADKPLDKVAESTVDAANDQGDQNKDQGVDDDTLRDEFQKMTKKELVTLGTELGLDMALVSGEVKDKIIEFLVENSPQ